MPSVSQRATRAGFRADAGGVFAPFYWEPTGIDDNSNKDRPVVTDPAAHDQPEYARPLKKGPGRITQFTGKDESSSA